VAVLSVEELRAELGGTVALTELEHCIGRLA
jgi:hypothetical protein